LCEVAGWIQDRSHYNLDNCADVCPIGTLFPSNRFGCDDTPWSATDKATEGTDEFKAACIQEANFLRAILAKDKKHALSYCTIKRREDSKELKKKFAWWDASSEP